MSSEALAYPDFAEESHKDYLELPKALGSVTPEELLAIAAEIDIQPDLKNNIKAQKTAGSAEIEASLCLDDPESEYLDYRLDLIDRGISRFEWVVESERELLERGYRDADDQTHWFRAQLHTKFSAAYKDVICGEVTAFTKDRLLEELSTLKERVAYTQSTSRLPWYAAYAAGLRGEITALIHLWERERYAFPATVRGDDGSYLPDQTHDILQISLDRHGEIKRTRYYEVKTGRIKEQHLGRYAARILHVTNTGIKAIKQNEAL